MPAYAVLAPSGQPSIVIDQHPQPASPYHPHPHPDSAAALNNASVGAVPPPPRPPTDVTATRRTDGSVLVQWTPPPSSSSEENRVDYYTLQYRTVGRWLPLVDQLPADTSSFVWTTASRGVLYRFRLSAVGRVSGSSAPSNVAILHVDGQQPRRPSPVILKYQSINQSLGDVLFRVLFRNNVLYLMKLYFFSTTLPVNVKPKRLAPKSTQTFHADPER